MLQAVKADGNNREMTVFPFFERQITGLLRTFFSAATYRKPIVLLATEAKTSKLLWSCF